MITAALLLSALAWGADPSSASTTATAGPLTVTGQDGSARHTHGGAPALLGHARFAVRWQGAEPAQLTVDRVAFLRGHGCDEPPQEVVSEPSFGGLFVPDSDMKESVRSLPLEPGASLVVDVGFPSVEAYYVWCDAFAFRVDFRAGDWRLSAVAETLVTRVEPLREP